MIMERRTFLQLLAAVGAVTSIPAPTEDAAAHDTLQPPEIKARRYLVGMTVATMYPATVSILSGDVLVYRMTTPAGGVGVTEGMLSLAVPAVPPGALTMQCNCPAIAKLVLVPSDTPLNMDDFMSADREAVLLTAG